MARVVGRQRTRGLPDLHFTGTAAGLACVGTVRFALDGTDYEIDLNAEHTEDLRGALANYVAHARKVGGTSHRGAARGSRRVSAVDTVAVRARARENGIDIKDRGRVLSDVIAKYQASACA